MTIRFCDFCGEEKKALKHIFETAFDITDFGRLLEAYDVFTRNFNGAPANTYEVIRRNKMLPKTTDPVFMEAFMNPLFETGIDLPVLLRKGDRAAKTVFIVAEDPLRDAKYPHNDIILGTPFATHMTGKTNKNLALYSNVTTKLLEDGYSVYLTDIVKFWIRKPGFNKLVLPQDLSQKLRASLQREIDYFRPQLIITYGNAAASLINSLAPSKPIPILSLPHPSGSANRAWKKILSAYYNDNSVKCTAENKMAYISARIDG